MISTSNKIQLTKKAAFFQILLMKGAFFMMNGEEWELELELELECELECEPVWLPGKIRMLIRMAL